MYTLQTPTNPKFNFLRRENKNTIVDTTDIYIKFSELNFLCAKSNPSRVTAVPWNRRVVRIKGRILYIIATTAGSDDIVLAPLRINKVARPHTNRDTKAVAFKIALIVGLASSIAKLPLLSSGPDDLWKAGRKAWREMVCE